MFLLKLLLKIILSPIMLTVALLQWVGIFLVGFSGVIFNIASSVLFVISVLALCFQMAEWNEVWKMLAVSFAIFLVLHIGEWIVTKVAELNGTLRGFIWAR